MAGLAYGVMIPGFPNDPFILPCILASLCSAIAFLLTAFFIPETNPAETNKQKKNLSLLAGLKELGRDRLIRDLIIVFCVNSFCNGAILLGAILFTSLDIAHGGLGFTPFENGIYYTIFGLVAVIYQFLLYKRVSKRLTILQTYLLGTILLAVSTLLYPLCGIPYWFWGKNSTTMIFTWMILIIVTTFNSIGFMSCLPVITGMLSNASDPERQGLVMGTSQSLSSGLRAFGPVVSGILLSAFTVIKSPWLFFIIFSLGYLACCLFIRRLNSEDIKRISEPNDEANSTNTNTNKIDNENNGIQLTDMKKNNISNLSNGSHNNNTIEESKVNDKEHEDASLLISSNK